MFHSRQIILIYVHTLFVLTKPAVELGAVQATVEQQSKCGFVCELLPRLEMLSMICCREK